MLAGLAYRPRWPVGLPAAFVTLIVATVCFAVAGLAVMTFVRSAQAVVGVTLGTLLPLAFISGIFVVGASFLPVVEAVSWIFPLRHRRRDDPVHRAGNLRPRVGSSGRAARMDAGRCDRPRAPIPLGGKETGHTARTSGK